MIISLITTWVLFGGLIGMNIYLKRKDWYLFLLSAIVMSAVIIILEWVWQPLAFWIPLIFYAGFLIWIFIKYIKPKKEKTIKNDGKTN